MPQKGPQMTPNAVCRLHTRGQTAVAVDTPARLLYQKGAS